MRTLLLMRGAPASGKSRFIRDNNLERFTLSADNIRVMVQSPTMDIDGNYTITQNNDQRVWKILFEMMEDRMKRGEFIIIDATHNNDKLIKRYKELADTYRYMVFYKEIEATLEECIERNKIRDEYKFVPEDVIQKCHRNIELQSVPNFCNKIDKIEEINNFYVENFDQYERMIVVGDIHGCYEPMKDMFEKFDIEDEKNVFVFLGDYIDRGIQNKEVMEKMLEIYKRKNVFCLEGNHENVLFNYSRGIDSGKRSFEQYTKPTLKGINLKEVKLFQKKLRQCLKVSFHGKKVLLTHGGLPLVPKEITYLATEQIIKGIGKYETEIDRIFHENIHLNDGYVQIHGHRNTGEDYPTSYSLEDEVEFGGNLKVMEITKEYMQIHKFKNDVWNEEAFQYNEDSYEKDTARLQTDCEEINKMSKSFLVKCKHVGKNLVSLNFTRSAFKKKAWNYMTIRARGLFVDQNTGKVNIKGYNKFFNMFEVVDTTPKSLEKNLKFPVRTYLKDNGFLGLVSHKDGELLIGTKSVISGDHVDILRDMIDEKLGDKKQELVKILEEYDITATFEVVSMDRDPHIISYDENELVLLNTFENKIDGAKDVGVEELKMLIEGTGVKYKTLLKVFDNFEEMMEYIKYEKKNSKTEGIVVEDSTGFMFKVKYDYYSDWKCCRSLIAKIMKENGYFEIRNAFSDTQARFGMWLSKNFKTIDIGSKSLIELRKMYEESIDAK